MDDRKPPGSGVIFEAFGHSHLGPYERTMWLPVPDDGDLAEKAERLLSDGYLFEMYEHGDHHIYMQVWSPHADGDGQLCHFIVPDQAETVVATVGELVREGYRLAYPEVQS